MRIITHVVGPLATNCYIISDENGAAAVIDPGAKPDEIESILKQNHLDLRNIILTHAHFDHIGALKSLKKIYPQIPVLMGKGDLARLTSAKDNRAVHQFGNPDDYTDLACDRFLNDGDQVKIGTINLTVYETPGHSKGSICLDDGENLFTGDTLFAGCVGRTDLEDGDFGEIMNSVKKLAALPGDRRVYPGHDMSTTLSFERENNPYIKESI